MMKQLVRSLVPYLIFGSLLLGTPALVAQTEVSPVLSEEELAKQREKEERIREYLRKKEERRVMQQMRQEEKARQRADKKNGTGDAGGKTESSDLPRNLARAQDIVRRSALGQDPSVQAYLELIDRQEASPHELAAFGNFLSESGMGRVAIEYYAIALALEKSDPLLWLNAGTLHRQNGDLGAALAAYNRTLALDENNAWAHYNIGAIFDDQGKYEDAIDAYVVALTIDPSLGDPTINPQATNNGRLLAVKLQLYQQQAGSLGLPLVPIPDADAPDNETSSDDDEN